MAASRKSGEGEGRITGLNTQVEKESYLKAPCSQRARVEIVAESQDLGILTGNVLRSTLCLGVGK